MEADPNSLKPLAEFTSPLQQCAMPLLSIISDRVAGIGTGFMVGNRYMLTAAHVVREYVQRRHRAFGPDGHFVDVGELHALLVSPERHGSEKEDYLGGPIPVVNAWLTDATDIALLRLNVPTYVPTGELLALPSALLRVSPPRVGDQIFAFGYHAMEVSWREQESQINYAQRTAVSQGVVEEVYPAGRDRGMLPFPCFRSSSVFAHGMSGGPIFTKDGLVCGVITSGSSFSNDSYGSILWPALAIRAVGVPSELVPGKQASMHELATRRIIAVDDSLADVSVEELNDTQQRVQYCPRCATDRLAERCT